MIEVTDGTLDFIQGKSRSTLTVSSKKPRRLCLRGVKKGLAQGGILTRYPAWDSALKMASIFKNDKKLQKYMKPDFKFIQLKKVKDVKFAPAYSIIIYGGTTHGHIEIKVPASHLIERGYTYALKSVKGKEVKVSLKDLEFVYISDYIDAFPRNHPSSRVANKFPENKRPLKAVFELVRI